MFKILSVFYLNRVDDMIVFFERFNYTKISKLKIIIRRCVRMIIGIDIDGTITKFPKIKPKWWCRKLPWYFYLGLFLVPPRKEVVDFIRIRKLNGDKIVLISARPKKMKRITEIYLKKHKIPYDKIFLVGLKDIKKRKEKIIKIEKVEIYIEY